MSARKILFITIDLHGGTGVFLRNLALGLRMYYPGEFEPTLLTMRQLPLEPGDTEVFRVHETLAARVDKSWSRLMEAATILPRMGRAIARLEPDVIITAGNYANLLVPLVAGSVPVVLTVHSNATDLLGDSSLAGILRPMLAWRYSRGMVVAPSKGVADDLRDNFMGSDVRVIPHGVNIEHIARLARQTDDVPTEPFILAVGRLTNAKDYPTMFHAYALARASTDMPPLLIVGGGELEEDLKQLLAMLNLQKHVRLLGHRANPYPYMKRTEFLVLSSRWEGFGLVLIEAMSLGAACIATDCPSGPGEILARGKYGMLVGVGDTDSLASAMVEMHDPRTRARFSSLASKRSSDYSLHRMVHDYRELLRDSVILRR